MLGMLRVWERKARDVFLISVPHTLGKGSFLIHQYRPYWGSHDLQMEEDILCSDCLSPRSPLVFTPARDKGSLAGLRFCM